MTKRLAALAAPQKKESEEERVEARDIAVSTRPSGAQPHRYAEM
jgi:hypothetical protein